MLNFINKYALVIVGLVLCNIAFAHNRQTATYMIEPTGKYGIGYQDVFLVNNQICPDAFYKQNVNENDFSKNNKQNCHEIALRIYYPATNTKEPHDEYYRPYINDTINWLTKTYELNQQEISILQSSQNIKTYTQQNAEPVTNKKFPLIIFMPGAGVQAQAYTNIISNLVSNGYIVIGVNSLFINGAIELKNGHVVFPPADGYIDADGRKENINDLNFVLNNIRKIKLKHGLEKNIDWNKIELIGHSRGAMSIVNLLKNKTSTNNIKALILLDPANMLGVTNYPLPDLNIPTITIWSPQFKINMHGSSKPAKNSITVTLKPKDAANNYSGHNNFMDSSTFQYHPAYQIPSLQKLPKLEKFGLGSGDGYEIASTINDYILIFTNNYLNSDSKKFELRCEAFNQSYLCEENK